MTTIILNHYMGAGGIGDYIRAALSLYAVAKKYGYTYYLTFTGNPLFGSCFETTPPPHDVLAKSEFMDWPYIVDDTKLENLEKIKKPGVYLLRSNTIGIIPVDEINAVREEFFRDVLRPSEAVKERVLQYYKQYNLSPGNYISVHIRCGDRHMGKNHSHPDNRADPSTLDYLDHATKILELKEFSKLDLPLVIHSDNEEYKQKLSNFLPGIINLKIDIQHIAELNLGNNSQEAYYSTVAEFYVMASAKAILSPGNYSGFSHVASMVNGIDLYRFYDSHYFHLLNVQNIKMP